MVVISSQELSTTEPSSNMSVKSKRALQKSRSSKKRRDMDRRMAEQRGILEKPNTGGRVQPDFPLGKAELHRLLRLFYSIAKSAEVKQVLRSTQRLDLQWNAFIRREARTQGYTVDELAAESGEAIKHWGNPSFNKVMNVITVLGYDLIAVPRDYLVNDRRTQGRETQAEQLRVVFLGAPNHILTREYLSSILWPWESYRDQRDYAGVDTVLTGMRKQFPELMSEVKTHWKGGWEYTPGEKQPVRKGGWPGGARDV